MGTGNGYAFNHKHIKTTDTFAWWFISGEQETNEDGNIIPHMERHYLPV
ncbi:MAG: hypothetical protein JXB88_24315 [Spirochaetales bacterium]|nr:hypothetical protein [Spirochaetales bacterium]